MKFIDVCDVFQKIESKTGRLEIEDALAALFTKAEPAEAKAIVYFLQGVVVPPFMGIDLGVGERMLERMLAQAYGYSLDEVEKDYKQTGDLGITAERLCNHRRQMPFFTEELHVLPLYDTLLKIARASGEGSQDRKISLGIGLFSSAKPIEARYIARYMLNRLRLGVGDPTIMNALALSLGKPREYRENIERAYNLCSDLGRVAEMLKQGHAPEEIHMQLFSPVRPALAERLNTAEDIIAKIGPCFADAKYDGFRLQVHKSQDRVEIYSRKLERLTPMFPDLVQEIKRLDGEWIFEGEGVGVKDGRLLSFQETIRRRRKHNIEEAAKKLPLHLFIFDVLYKDGQPLIDQPFKTRRQIVEQLSGERLGPSEGKYVETAEELQAFFEHCISKGLEGVVAKDPTKPYIAGARKFAWIKLKKSYGGLADTVDAVVVGYYLGKGERAGTLGGVLAAVYNPDLDRFETIAKVGSGLSEEEMEALKNTLDSLRIPQPASNVFTKLEVDVWVQPEVVITIMADEITDSPLHTCAWNGHRGLALRFPRIVQIREDKGPYEITTVKEILEMRRLQSNAQ